MPSVPWAPQVEWDFRTGDLAAYRARVAGLLKPFTLTGKPRGSYDARLAHRRLGRSELTFIGYGEEVSVDAGMMNDFYLMQVPLSGQYNARYCGGSAVIRAGEAHLIHDSMPLAMEFSGDLNLLVFKFDRRMLPSLAADGRSAGEDRRGYIMPLDDGPGLSLSRTVAFVAGESMRRGLLSDCTAAGRHAEALLVSAIRACRPAEPERLLRHVRDNAYPPCVRRAEDFIEKHLRDDITLDQIVAASWVGARTLFYGFRKAHGIGPWGWLRMRRLDGVRQTLQSRDSAIRVTDVALDWGFAHLGRFSAAYRMQFGEAPSETLARVRRGRTD